MPTIKGTASIASSAAQNKLLRSTQFPASFSQQVDVSKVNASVVTLWVEKEIERILGFEDEIVASMAVNLFFPKIKQDDMNAPVTYGKVDPRTAQLDLAGFLGEDEAAKFASELWNMMLDGQNQPRGIPKILIEQKKAEIAAQKAAAAKEGGTSGKSYLAAEAARRARAARQQLGHRTQKRPQNRNWQQVERHNQPRPVSPQNSVQHRKDPVERSRYDRDEGRRRSRSRSRNRYEKKRDEYSDDSSAEGSHGRRRRHKNRYRRDRDYDDEDRRSRKHSSSRRRRSHSRSRSRSNDRSRISLSRNYRDERDRVSDRKARGRSRRERDYSRSRSRSNHRGRGRSESSHGSRDSRRSYSSSR